MKKEFVKIHSAINILVSPGLQNKNITNSNSRLEDRLKVIPQWQNACVQILKGEGIYPAEIIEWNTVKILANKGVFTIGQFCDINGIEEEKAKKAKEDKSTINKAEFLNLQDIVKDKGE